MLSGNPSALECLEEAIRLFRQVEKDQNKACNFNIAKCLYEKANLLMNTHSYDGSYAP